MNKISNEVGTIFTPCPHCGEKPLPTNKEGHCGHCGAWLLEVRTDGSVNQIKNKKINGNELMGMKFYTNKCVVCQKNVSQNACEILQPELFVCWNCMENARQMLAIKAFAKDVNVKIDFGMIEKAEVEKIKAAFDLDVVK